MSPTMGFDGDAGGSDGGADADGTDDGDAGGGADADHLEELADGAGCTEIWEHLSEGRDE